MQVLERYFDSLRLPIGHIERKAAEKAVNEEYSRARALEKRWTKKLGRNPLVSIETADSLGKALCRYIGVKSPRQTYLLSFEDSKRCDAMYQSMHMYLPSIVELRSVIHELAHHVNHVEKMIEGHGEDFLFAEDLLFQTYYEYQQQNSRS